MALFDQLDRVSDDVLRFPLSMSPQIGGRDFMLAEAANNFV
jgi:hypothetical protein